MNRHRSSPLLGAVILFGAIALTACGTQRPSPDTGGTSGKENTRITLETAYELLNEGKLIEAQVDFSRIANTAPPQSPEYRLALAGKSLVHIAPGDNPVYDADKALNALDELHRNIASASDSVTVSEGLLFTALRRALEADLRARSARKELEEIKREKADLIKEKKQLEEALTKLRRLSLE